MNLEKVGCFVRRRRWARLRGPYSKPFAFHMLLLSTRILGNTMRHAVRNKGLREKASCAYPRS